VIKTLRSGDSTRNPLSINSTGSATGLVNLKQKSRVYKFTLTGSSSFNSTLTKLKDNADLRLLNASGKVLIQSQKPGKRSETLNATLDSGTYFVRVSLGKVGKQTKGTRFQLTLTSNIISSNPSPSPKPIPGPNTPPVLGGSLTLNTARGGAIPVSTVLTKGLLNTTDAQQGSAQLTYTLTALPKQGSVFRNGIALGLGSKFTQADIDNGFVSYQEQSVFTLPNGSNVNHSVNAGNLAISSKVAANPVISGKNIAWIGGGEGTPNVFFYNGTTKSTTQLTSGAGNYVNVQIYGSTVVWQNAPTGNQSDIQFSIAGGTVQTIDNSTTFDDTSPVLFGDRIAFRRNDLNASDGSGDGIYLYKIGGTTQQLSSNSENSFDLQIDGSTVVWERLVSGLPYNGDYNVRFVKENVAPRTSLPIDSSRSEYSPALFGNKIAFIRGDASGFNTAEDGVYLYDPTTDSSTPLEQAPDKITSLNASNTALTWTRDYGNSNGDIHYSIAGGAVQTINSSTTLNDYSSIIDGNKIVFVRDDKSGTAADGIYLFDTSSASIKQLSSGSSNVFLGGISGNNVVWRSADSNGQVFFYDGDTSSDSFGFTVSDGSVSLSGTLNINITA